MCGISALFSASPLASNSESVLTKMNRAQAHRGPDDEGYFSDENVVLGHRRLSIIDLSGGHQPIFNEDNTVAVVFNGDI
ncbi:MAG: asparagine synthetase B, partial [Pseudomonadota bacterium]|nr:asparagine synthetase B [Pseudomonadota bacterium]